MKKKLLLLLLMFALFLGVNIPAQLYAQDPDIIVMKDTVITVATTAKFYDSGGLTAIIGDIPGYYGNYENYTLTVHPAAPDKFLYVTFESYNTESCCDFLKIYRGENTNGELVGTIK